MSHNFQMGYSVEKENYADNVDKKKNINFSLLTTL